ncbi:MAG: hypothetical protein WBA63_02785 [Thermomicrobiales bacterium]
MSALRWRAGSAVATFPIAPGTELGGYIDRAGPASTTLDELEIGAFILQIGERRLAIVTADVVAVDVALTDAIASASGIPRDELLLCASHTHSGPRGIVDRLHPADPSAADTDLRKRFIEIATATLAGATRRLEPVTLDLTEWQTANAWSNRNAEDGPNDPRVRLLITRRDDGSLQTALALVACHPTILGASSTVVSADLMGGIRRALAGAFAQGGEQPVVLSLTGAAGDISTRFTRQSSTPAEIERLGALAIQGRDTALASSRPVPASANALRNERVTCRLASVLDTSADFDPEREMREAEQRLRELDATGGSEAERRRAITQRQGAYLRSLLRDVPSERFDLELSAWRLGNDCALVSVPGELFTSLGAEIERASPFAATWVAGYANGYAGYIADPAAYETRTYEAMASPFGMNAGETVTGTAQRLLVALKDT